MKINEISISQDIKTFLISDLEKLIAKYNWHFLGRGFEAAVAEHPNKKYVLKIFKAESFYNHFVRLAQRYKNNQHFPKFYSKVKTIPGASHWHFIRMEKLEPITDELLLSQYQSELFYLCESAKKSWIPGGLLMYNKELKAIAGKEYNFNYNPLQTPQPEIWQYIQQPPAKWKQAADAVTKLAGKMNLINLDLHETNFMRRGETLVFLDPYVE